MQQVVLDGFLVVQALVWGMTARLLSPSTSTSWDSLRTSIPYPAAIPSSTLAQSGWLNIAAVGRTRITRVRSRTPCDRHQSAAR